MTLHRTRLATFAIEVDENITTLNEKGWDRVVGRIGDVGDDLVEMVHDLVTRHLPKDLAELIVVREVRE